MFQRFTCETFGTQNTPGFDGYRREALKKECRSSVEKLLSVLMDIIYIPSRTVANSVEKTEEEICDAL